jgi:hypothetical protein
MPDPGTVFQSLDGDSPGSEAPGEDISGIPLQPMSEGPPDYANQSNSQYSSVPGSQEPAHAVEESGSVPSDSEAQPQGSRNRRTAAERISQLTRRRREAEGEASQLRAQVQDLSTRLQEQSRLLGEIRRVPQGEIRRVPQGDSAPYDGGAEGLPAPAGDIEGTIFPEFGDTNSAERRTFNEIWRNSSLRGDPDGPLQVAYQVRGVLADEVARRADQEPRKRAASVIKPGPVPQDSTTSAADVKRKNVSAEGLRRIRLGSDDPQDYIAVRKAQRRSGKRAHIQEGF